MTDAHNEIFGISSTIRYVAFANGQQAELRSRPNLQDASRAEGDRYEELLVREILDVVARHFPTRRDTGG